jgi:multiple sugar transport system substrate-binding protein
MRKILKTISVIVVVSLLLLTNAGLTLAAWSLEDAAKPYAGTTIHFVTIAWPETMRKLASEFSARTGIEVQVSNLGHQALYEQVMLDFRLGTSKIDVFTPVGYNMKEYVDMGFLLNLEPYLADSKLADPDFAWDDFLGPVDQFVIFEGARYGIPLRAAPMFLFYRSDLFEQYADEFENQFGYELVPPRTWSEYLDVAKFFNEIEWKAPDGGRGYGTAEHGMKEFSMFYMFRQRFSGIAKEELGIPLNLLDDQYNPTFDNELGVKAVRNWIESLNYAPPGALQCGNAETKQLFAQGKVAMTVQFGSLYTLLGDSPVAGKFAMAVVPGGSPEAGVPPVAVNSTSRNPRAAFLFAQWLTSKEIDLSKFLDGGIEPARKTSLAADAYQKVNPFYGVVIDSLEQAMSLPVLPEFAQLETATADELHPALTRQISPEEAIENLRSRFVDILTEGGYY